MNEEELKNRTKQIALRAIRLVESLPPDNLSALIIGRRLLRAAASVGANYRAACRGRSDADLLDKLSIVEEEADETLYWLELLAEANLVSENKLLALKADINEIVAMTVSSINTMRFKKIGWYKRSIAQKSKIPTHRSKI